MIRHHPNRPPSQELWGHDVPEMPNCPLVPLGAQAVVRSAEDGGLVVDIRSDEPDAARDILGRAQRLVPAGAPAPAPSL